jgi:hypothetical protein
MMQSILSWFGQHERAVIVLIVCTAALLAVALLLGDDVMIFFRWLGELVGQ